MRQSVLLLLFLCSCVPTPADKPSNTPQNIEVVSIYDGDTFTVNIGNWPDIVGERISVRIKNVDCPELKDNRQTVKELARQAKVFTVTKLRAAQIIELENIERDKYFRLLADVYVDGTNLGNELLKAKLAQRYNGGKKPKWEAENITDEQHNTTTNQKGIGP